MKKMYEIPELTFLEDFKDVLYVSVGDGYKLEMENDGQFVKDFFSDEL